MANALTNSKTFQAVSLSWPYAGKSEPVPFGGRPKLRYEVGNDTIKATNSDGHEFVFETPGIAQGFPFSSPATYEIKDANGTTLQKLQIWAPAVDGVRLTYLREAWLYDETEDQVGRAWLDQMIFGFETPTNDMPVSGAGVYSTAINASGWASGRLYSFFQDAKATFDVNFGTGKISTNIFLVGIDSDRSSTFDFGVIFGTGSIAGKGPGFSGIFDDGKGVFQGAFFGPAAAEMGYHFVFRDDLLDARGSVVGRKKP